MSKARERHTCRFESGTRKRLVRRTKITRSRR